MPNTITSYHTFSANTKARAAQVNTNFSNYRGTLVPINTDTATASDDTHDLGSTEHRWQYAYVRAVDFKSSTSTATVQWSGDTAATTGAAVCKIGGTEKFRVDTNGFNALNGTPMGATTTAARGQIALSPTLTGSSQTTTTQYIADSTITLTTIGRPVAIFLIATDTNTITVDQVSVGCLTGTTTAEQVGIRAALGLYRNTTTSLITYCKYGGSFVASTSGAATFETPGSRLLTIDFPSAGTQTYFISIALFTATRPIEARVFSSRLVAYEL